MPQSDFTIESLAAHLHLTPQQVSRLADRNKLPGRKVGGKWRFSRADIHHWLERRIGLSIKRLEIEDEQNLLSEYVNNMRPATSTFGEILRENLQEKLNED